jgi:Double zinc ribbon
MALLARQCVCCGAALEPQSLECSFCGTNHVVTAEGTLGGSCRECGAANQPGARSCVQCRGALAFPCPECRASNPLGSRYCQECQIEFRRYRQAAIHRAPDQVRAERVRGLVIEWLDTRWFKARDIEERLRVLEQTLVWLPVWHLRGRAVGRVQGKVSQTHYRTVSRRSYDREGERWVDKVDSVPYTVWQEVSKDFDQPVAEDLPGASHPELYEFLRQPWGEPLGLELIDPDGDDPGLRTVGGAEAERVFEPEVSDERAFGRLRKRAERHLRAELLDKVEGLDVRFLQPTLTLTFYPVWEVLYRYRRSHGTVRINGVTRELDGKRVSLLNQWFG